MFFAVCLDNQMLVGILICLAVMGAIAVTPIILLMIAVARWADAWTNARRY